MDRQSFKELKTLGKKKCTLCNEIKLISEFYKTSSNSKYNSLKGPCKKCNIEYKKKYIKNKEFGTKWLMSLRENGTKRCFSCMEILPFDKFGKNKSNVDGYSASCKICKSKRDKEYRDSDKHRQKLLDKKKEYYYRVKHTERHFINVKKARERRNYKDEYQKMRANEWRRVKDDFRKLINASFKKREWVQKDTKTEQLLGADYFTVKEYIERQFLKGMTWENHGEWHLDHIIPLDSAGKDKDILYRLFYYKNMTPMWWKDNLSKNYKIPEVCTLWSNPIVPYKEFDQVFEPTHGGNVGSRLFIDKGTRFGRLMVIEEVESIKLNSGWNRRRFKCLCDCGIEKIINMQSLRSGVTKSCGCYHRDVISGKRK
jgi:hypothetical protein